MKLQEFFTIRLLGDHRAEWVDIIWYSLPLVSTRCISHLKWDTREWKPRINYRFHGLSFFSLCSNKLICKEVFSTKEIPHTSSTNESGSVHASPVIRQTCFHHDCSEKCQEQNSDLFVTFADLTKAFDTVSRDGLWKTKEKFCCPSKFITTVRQFHEGMMVKVLDMTETSQNTSQ